MDQLLKQAENGHKTTAAGAAVSAYGANKLYTSAKHAKTLQDNTYKFMRDKGSQPSFKKHVDTLYTRGKLPDWYDSRKSNLKNHLELNKKIKASGKVGKIAVAGGAALTLAGAARSILANKNKQ